MSITAPVLTITATEYCLMEGRDLREYRAMGVQGECGFLQRPEMDILRHLPEGTEVVVGYRSNILNQEPTTPGGPPQSRHHYYGTALIHRETEKKLKSEKGK